jgi:hypothetical protein
MDEASSEAKKVTSPAKSSALPTGAGNKDSFIFESFHEGGRCWALKGVGWLFRTGATLPLLARAAMERVSEGRLAQAKERSKEYFDK